MRTSEPLPRQRGVWTATAVGVAAVIVVTAVLYLPIVTFFAGVSASSAGAVPFPLIGTVLVTVLGLVVTAALLLCAVTRRRAAAAWIATAGAIAVAVIAALMPGVLAVSASVGRASEIVPFVTDLWQRFSG